jgi:competence protein ComEA
MLCNLRILLFSSILFGLLLCSGDLSAEQTKLEGVVNINTATAEELRLIPSVGPSRIRNILAYRRAHPFRTVDELARIKGIGRKTVRRLRPHLAVSGPTTAQRVLRPEPLPGPPQPPPQPEKPKVEPRKVEPRKTPALARPQARRGEPAHAAMLQATGNRCLPPP